MVTETHERVRAPEETLDKRKLRIQRRWSSAIFKHALLIFWTLIVLFPIYWMVMTSFKDSHEWVTWPPRWYPHDPTIYNYRQIFYFGGESGTLRREASEQPYTIWKGIADSSFIAAMASVIAVILGSSLAYAISRFGVGGKKFPEAVLTIRMLPPIVIAVPFLIWFPLIGLFDTYTGLILVYIATTLPFVIWMMLSFIEEVPKELEFAGRMMGAGRIFTLRKVVFPLVASGMVVTLLFTFILCWSEFLLALTLTQPKVSTLPILLNKFQSAVEGRLYGPQAAIGTVITIPVVVLGFLIQKHLVKGFSFGMIRK
ncbi:MAG: carbohydrate ABC transporter permease [Nitrospinota bacterium]